MDFSPQQSPSAAPGRGLEALGLVLVILLVTAQAWAGLWFGPAFEEGMRNLLTRTHAPPPTLPQKFAAAWQWMIAVAALGSIACVLFRSQWMRLASIVWCGSLIILAIATSIGRGVTPIAVLTVLAAIATSVGIEVFRARAV